MLILSIVFLIVRNDPLDFSDKTNMILSKNEHQYECLYRLNYWSTWASSGVLSIAYGSYLGLLFQNKKYGGQLFI